MRIEHVLFDADGVLQRGSTQLTVGLTGHLGEEAATAFLEETFSGDPATLRGEVELVPLLRSVLSTLDRPVDVDRFYAETSLAIETDPDSMAMVGGLRDAGYGVHLGTNQDPARARFMRTELGYDDLFDVSCYSCELGLAKPDPAYFRRAVELIGAAAERVLFVDDTEPNVTAAREVGLAGVHWSLDHGHEALRAAFADHGVQIG